MAKYIWLYLSAVFCVCLICTCIVNLCTAVRSLQKIITIMCQYNKQDTWLLVRFTVDFVSVTFHVSPPTFNLLYISLSLWRT